jgi:GT2 family glycosyltransferase
MSVDLSISIVNYNTKDLLKACLDSVFSETQGISYEIFVVDNASKDGSVEMVAGDYPTVKLIANKKNLGFAAANNQALAQSKGRYFLLLNPDTEVVDNALATLVEFMEQQSDCGICCPQLVYPDGRFQMSYTRFRTSKNRAMWEVRPRIRDFKSMIKKMISYDSDSGTNNKKEIDFPTVPKEVDRPRGACFMVRQEAIEQVGYMDERFFMYCEEVDWALRMSQAGWKRYFVPEARVTHIWGASTEKKNRLMDDIHTQSDYKFHYKHYGLYGLSLVWGGHALGMFLSTMLGVYATGFSWLGLNDFTPQEQFEASRELLRKMFLIKDIRPKE